MAKIWAERLLAGTRKFNDVPFSLKLAVKEILQIKFNNGDISEEEFQKALGGNIYA